MRKKSRKKPLVHRQRQRPGCSPKRRKKSQKLISNTHIVNDELEPISLIIKTPTSTLCKNLPSSFGNDVFDDGLIGTPKSVADLFNSEVISKHHKHTATDLAFLDEDIEHFDFDSSSSVYANAGALPFGTIEYDEPETVCTTTQKNVGRNISTAESIMEFPDLEIDLGRAAFMVDDIIAHPEQVFHFSGSNSDKLKTWVRESRTMVNEEEFISGLLV